MRYKLLPTWQHVEALTRKIEHLFRKIQTAGSPPTGVEGKRIVRAYRSEIDKKSKHEIAKWRKKIEKHYEQEKQKMIMAGVKNVRIPFDEKIEQLEQTMRNETVGRFSWGGGGRLKLEKELANLKREKELRMKSEQEHLNHILSEKFKTRVDHEVEIFKRKLAPHGFYFRLKYAIDTYGGRAYAGSMVLATDPEGKGWRKMGSITAPRKT